MIETGLQGWELACTAVGCAVGVIGLGVLAYEAYDVWVYGTDKESNEKG